MPTTPTTMTCTHTTQNRAVPPDRPRADSRARAEAAFKLKCRGRTWQEIADELGFKSRNSALNAVRRMMLREAPESLETRRAYTVGAYRQSLASLFRTLEKAETANDVEAVVSIARAIGYIADKNARLTGQQIPVIQEVEHNVHVEVKTTATSVIDQAEKDLLAITAGKQDAGMMPIIEAEFVEVSA